MKTVYLSGFMGCGKTSLGRKAACALNLSFTDLDEFIAEREGMSIAEIFAVHGEQYFRGLERSALADINADVVALGGGTQFSGGAAAVVFIDTPFGICSQRIMNDKCRPNAAGKSLDELFALYESRVQTYKANADHIVSNENEILCLLAELFGKEDNRFENAK